jgi:hypothetical protein
MTSLCSDTVFLPNFKESRTCTKKGKTSLIPRVLHQLLLSIYGKKKLLPLTKYLPKHVRKGSTRGRVHHAYRGLLITVPTVVGA